MKIKCDTAVIQNLKIVLKTSQDKQTKLTFFYQFYIRKFFELVLTAESYFMVR